MIHKHGKKFGIVDFTRGEMGTRGNASIRADEAEEAAKILGADVRRNLEIPDSDIELSRPNLLKVVQVIREFQPEIVFAPYRKERHPDHVRAHQLVSQALFYSGLIKLKTGSLAPYRPRRGFYYMQHRQFNPTLYVDISGEYETKVAAIKAHKSQFFNPESKEPETVLSTPEFMEYLLGRMRYFGRMAGVKYAEPFWTEEPITVTDFNGVL